MTDYPLVALEIAPPSNSGFALSEQSSVPLAWATALTADPKVNVEVNVSGSETDIFSSQGHVLLSRPSLIAAKGDLTLTGELAKGTVTFALGRSLLGSKASLTLRPLATPSVQPPVVRALTLAAHLAVVLPTRAELESYAGTLSSALGDPAPSYLVRGFPASVTEPTTNPLTSVTLTGADGTFTVLTDPLTREATPDGTMWLEFWDSTETNLSPRLFSDVISTKAPANASSRTQWRLPAWVTPSTLRFLVGGGESVSSALKDVALRFRTSIKSSGSGKAVYSQEGKTDVYGQVDVPLLPGTLEEARLYDVAVVPPPDSPFDGKCLTAFPVTAPPSASGDVPVASVIHLARKWQLAGTVRNAAGAVVPGATLTATRVSTDNGHACLEGLVPQTVSGNSDSKGAFALLLEAGVYRLEVDPATGSPWPRLSLSRAGEMLTIAADTVRDLTLPNGVVTAGQLSGPSGEAVANADVRVFVANCRVDTCASGGPPLLGTARTDAAGNFRVVLPAP